MRKWRPMKAAVIIAAVLALAGCSSQGSTASDKSRKQLWYLSGDECGLVQSPYSGDAETDSALIEDFLEELQTAPEKTDYRPLLEDNVRILDDTLENGILTLNFSPAYARMSSTREVLARAGLVRTFTQLNGISGVKFTIGGRDATSPSGEPLGVMDANTFVEDSGKQINSIQHLAINLYFTDDTGTVLKREARSIYYTSSKPLEWAIVERIIAGPKVDGSYPTVPSNTQIISVTSANGTCYVNLNQTFLTNALSVDARIPIYSIVNSLIDDCRDIDEVQISVEGESNLIFKQIMDLSHPYEADYTLVESGD